jgi:hypothetical protein
MVKNRSVRVLNMAYCQLGRLDWHGALDTIKKMQKNLNPNQSTFAGGNWGGTSKGTDDEDLFSDSELDIPKPEPESPSKLALKAVEAEPKKGKKGGKKAKKQPEKSPEKEKKKKKGGKKKKKKKNAMPEMSPENKERFERDKNAFK